MSSNNSGCGGKTLLAVLLIGCIAAYFILKMSKKDKVFLFNPYEETMIVTIDDKEYEVEPISKQKISLEPGEYSVKSSVSGEQLIDTVFQYDKNFHNGVLNVSGQSMYLWYEEYGDWETLGDDYYTESLDSVFSLSFIDTTAIMGWFTEYEPNELLIEKDWDYFLDTPFPEEIDIANVYSIVIKKKIFSEDELLDYWNNEYDEDIDFDEIIELLEEEDVPIDLTDEAVPEIVE